MDKKEMKKVADQFRILVSESDIKEFQSRPSCYIDPSKKGYYKHGMNYFKYLGSECWIDYFTELEDLDYPFAAGFPAEGESGKDL